ncbi:hypothetical protein BB8028_0004g10770 [Beauveria bassiana]|uniref:GPI anchored protein n=1 Tax=Beauveria bassiana TaxID=176275 RepID=A0A2S7YDG3_BEABA|nr:hypothetical protein BB8028_0004g10770 [Beauveria bassiana]
MRVLQIFVTASLAMAANAGITGDSDGALPSSVSLASSPSSLPVATAIRVAASSEPISINNATVVASSLSPQTAAGPANSSTHTTAQSTATPETTSHANATSSKSADATGGAILPQMQGSMVGLLGFCIMSLMLL